MNKAATFYIAGPMSGRPYFNVPAFHNAAGALRARYPLEVYINPADRDTPTMQAYALASEDGGLADREEVTSETWGQVLARDVELVADHVDGIVLLPGWEKSSGARLEATVGLLCGHAFYLYVPHKGDRERVASAAIASQIKRV